MLNYKNLSANILIVDDQEENLFLLESILSKIGCNTTVLSDEREAISQLSQAKYDLVILDILMPYINGFELCRLIKADENYCDIPIMFISSLENEKDIVQAFEVGAVDYITKPIKKLEVIARVQNQLSYKIKYSSLVNTMQFAFHELQTPINIIQNDTYMLELLHGNTQSHDRINIAMTILQSIYGDLYYAVKKEQLFKQEENTNIIIVIKNYINYFSLMASNKSIKIIFDYSVDECTVLVLRVALERLVSNTISNAIKYATKNSKVKIKISKTNQGIIFAVENKSNTNIDFNNFFKSGYKEVEKIKGIGIGMEIIRQICIDFKIQVETQFKNNNIIFKFLIPFA